MSVSNIVLRSGVGPTATIGLFITHGLGSGAAPVVTGPSGVRRLTMYELQSHPQVAYERLQRKRRLENEEEELLSLLLGLADDIMD